MNKQLDQNLARGIALGMADLNMETAAEFMAFVRLNTWLSSDCLEEIKQHAQKAERIIKLVRKLEEKQLQQKKKPPAATSH